MKENLDSLEEFAVEVILGRKKGFRANVLRFVLGGLSIIYKALVRLRLFLYQNRYLKSRPIGCMVISIGNLTVGGTGKTPVVELFARTLQKAGRNVGILSRGYKSEKPPSENPPDFATKLRRFLDHEETPPELPRVVSDGKSILLNSLNAGDEPYMLAQNLPGVPIVVDKDRVNAGQHAIANFGCDTLLLDDGLQYLKLQHRLEVVLIDHNTPFGNERILPRGTLREPPENLKRANYIFVTKCNGYDERLVERLRRYNLTAEIIHCRHRPVYLQNVITGERRPLSDLESAFVGTISGIAVPENFEKSLTKLGAKVEVTRRCTDHHTYTVDEVLIFISRCLNRDVDMVVTTEKDSVRFPILEDPDVPIYFLRVEIEILDGQDIFDRCIAKICQERPDVPGGRYY